MLQRKCQGSSNWSPISWFRAQIGIRVSQEERMQSMGQKMLNLLMQRKVHLYTGAIVTASCYIVLCRDTCSFITGRKLQTWGFCERFVVCIPRVSLSLSLSPTRASRGWFWCFCPILTLCHPSLILPSYFVKYHMLESLGFEWLVLAMTR